MVQKFLKLFYFYRTQTEKFMMEKPDCKTYNTDL